MARRFLIALVFFATVTTVVIADELNLVNDDLLIRHVVDDNEDHLLNAEQRFSTFKSKFRKTYATKDEHDYRFGVFKSNMRRAKLHQKLDPSAEHGVTKFSDQSGAISQQSSFRR